jgi:hypothetical protein
MLASYSSARDKGLYVSQKAATSFEVHELGGGASSVSFDYRIVALRKNFENIRMQDHTKDLDPARLWKSSKVVAPEKVGDVMDWTLMEGQISCGQKAGTISIKGTRRFVGP